MSTLTPAERDALATLAASQSGPALAATLAMLSR
jgi:hypothetical protein